MRNPFLFFSDLVKHPLFFERTDDVSYNEANQQFG